MINQWIKKKINLSIKKIIVSCSQNVHSTCSSKIEVVDDTGPWVLIYCSLVARGLPSRGYIGLRTIPVSWSSASESWSDLFYTPFVCVLQTEALVRATIPRDLVKVLGVEVSGYSSAVYGVLHRVTMNRDMRSRAKQLVHSLFSQQQINLHLFS